MERHTQSDPLKKEVPYDPPNSQEEVSSKMEAKEPEIMPDLISFTTETLECTADIKIVNNNETDSSDPAGAGQPNLTILKHVAEVVESPIADDGAEVSPTISCYVVTFEDKEMNISTEATNVSSIKFDAPKRPQTSNSSMSKSEASVEETTSICVDSPVSTIVRDTIESIKNASSGNIAVEYNKVDLYAEADVPITKFGSSSPQASGSIISKNEANIGETSRIIVRTPESSTEQDTPDGTKSTSYGTIILEDSKADLSEETVVSPTKFDSSNRLQGSHFSVSTNEAKTGETPRICSSESSIEQDTPENAKNACDSMEHNKIDLSAETDHISPIKFGPSDILHGIQNSNEGSPAQLFVSGNASISSCDTPERSLLSYSTLMEASPSIFAQQATRYAKQEHLKLRINELEQSLAKLKLQLRQKEAVIINLQMEKNNAIKETEKISKAPVPMDNIATIKKLQKYEEELQEAKLKIAELEKLENEKSLLETKIKAQEQDYSALEKKYEEVALQLKTCEQKNFDMILEVERAERVKKKALDTMGQYETLLMNCTTAKINLKGCLEEVMLKYERAKSLILGFKNNEDLYKKENDDLRDKLKTFAEQYENFKLQALAQIEEANKENLKLRKQLHQEKKVRKPIGKK